MKLYTDNRGAWAGTQLDAKAQFGNDYALVEVPVSKEALLNWLNKCRVLSQTHVEAANLNSASAEPEHKQTRQGEGKTPFELAQQLTLDQMQTIVYRYLNDVDEIINKS
jgi:hypothetical protein